MAIVEKRRNKKEVKEHYLLTYHYTLGSGDGSVKEVEKISIDNPYLERFYTLMNSLVPLDGNWGICFGEDYPENFYEAGQITQDDHYFLDYLMFDNGEIEGNPYIKDEEEPQAFEFYYGIRGETESSFLTFDGLKLHKVKSDGTKVLMEVV